MVARQKLDPIFEGLSPDQAVALQAWAPRFAPESDESALHPAVAGLQSIVGADRCSILIPFGRNGLRVLASSDRRSIGDLIVDRNRYPELVSVLDRFRPICVPDLAQDTRFRSISNQVVDLGQISIAAVPFQLSKQTVILRVTSRHRQLGNSEIRLLKAASQLLELASSEHPAKAVSDSPELSVALKLADAVFDVRPDGTVEQALGSIEKSFGVAPHQLQDKALDDLIGEKTLGSATHQLLALLEGQHLGGGSTFQAILPGKKSVAVRLWGVRIPGLPSRALIAAQRVLDLENVINQSIAALPVPALAIARSTRTVVSTNDAFAKLAATDRSRILGAHFDELFASHGDQTVLAIGPGGDLAVEVFRDPEISASGPEVMVVLDRRLTSQAQRRHRTMKEALSRQAKELEELQTQLDERVSSQSRFLSASAHELKTPLSVIQSYLETVLSDLSAGLDEEQLTFLNIAHESTLRLRRLVVDIIDLAALDSGELSMQIEKIDVRPLITRVCDEMREIARKATITLETDGVSSLPPIRADSERLLQVFNNLLDNSIKFTPEGGCILVSGSCDDDSVKLSVTDTGTGIPTEELGSVFEEFVQGRRRPQGQKTEGTGLGLAICRRIVRALGGKISAENQHGRGTAFVVTLPRWPDHDASEDEVRNPK
jgi:signal transduction histidine kinase